MKTSEYWGKRFNMLEQSQHDRGAAAFSEIDRKYRTAEREIERKIATWYQRFADNNGITLQEAQKWLSGRDLEEFKWDVNQYIRYGQENAVNGIWTKQLENASARFHISRLEALKIQCQQDIEVLFGGQKDVFDQVMSDVYRSAYYRTAFEIHRGVGVGWDFATLDNKTISKIINKPWAVDGITFSDRIWLDKQKLLSELDNTLTQNIILGQDSQKAIDAISRRLGVSKANAGRLVMTEEAYFSSEAQNSCFKELDIEQYEIVAMLDSRTSEICRMMDGKVFKMSEWKVGITAPPFHPWCRTTTVPHFDDDFDIGERSARGADGKTYYVPANMKYADWEKAFVRGDKSSVQSIQNSVNYPVIVKIAGVDVEKSTGSHSFSNGAGQATTLSKAAIYKLQDGTRFVFPEIYNTAHQSMTPEKAIELWYRVPDSVRKQSQKVVEFVDYYNPQDFYWKQVYKNFTQSYATGGDTITFYRWDYPHDDDYVIRTYCHEAGHFIDKTRSTTGIPYSLCQDWTDAMKHDMLYSGKKSPTVYGENSNAEDFAESVAEFTQDLTSFEKDFPNRATLLKSIFK